MRVILVTIAGTGLVIGGLCLFLFEQLAATRAQDGEAALRALANQVEEEIAGTARDLAARADLIAHMPPIRAALAEQDRAALVALMGESYAALNARYGLTNAQVNSAATNTVLHRFHSPRDAGDDFTRNRQIIVATHGANQAQMGVEIGASGVRVRGAAPVSTDRVLGSVEFGVELQPLLEALRARTNADFATLIDRRLIPTTTAGDVRLFGSLRGDSATTWPLVVRLHETLAITLVKEPVFSFPNIHGVPFGAATIPLLDYSGAEIGVIIAMTSLAPEQRTLRRLAVATAAAGLIAWIGLAGIILLLFRGLVLRPVSIIAEALEAPGGATPPSLPKPGAAPELDRLIRAAARTREPAP
ncbi:cache domain-containing protein [Roseomonas sp. F4]